jgi:hypothetical protein
MKFCPVVLLAAIGFCAMAQPTPPKAADTHPPVMTGPDGATMPLQIAPPPPTLPPDRVVVKVGEIAITAGQLDQILEAYSDTQRVFVNGPGRQAFIDQLVRVLTLAQEGKRRKLDQTDLFHNQLTFSAAGILSAHTEIEIRKNLKIDDGMLQNYMNEHPLDYMQVRARHILIRMQGSAAPLQPGKPDLTEAEALAKAQELRKKIDEGQDFAKLASAESDDASTSEKGGDLGFFKRGQMPPSFEEAAYKLKPGEVSQPVKTSVGYTLLKVEEIKPIRSFELLRPDLERNLRMELGKKYVDDLRALTKVEIDPEFASPGKSIVAPKAAQ